MAKDQASVNLRLYILIYFTYLDTYLSIHYVHHRYEWSYLLLGALVDNKNKIRNEWRVPASPRPVRAGR